MIDISHGKAVMLSYKGYSLLGTAKAVVLTLCKGFYKAPIYHLCKGSIYPLQTPFNKLPFKEGPYTGLHASLNGPSESFIALRPYKPPLCIGPEKSLHTPP